MVDRLASGVPQVGHNPLARAIWSSWLVGGRDLLSPPLVSISVCERLDPATSTLSSLALRFRRCLCCAPNRFRLWVASLARA